MAKIRTGEVSVMESVPKERTEQDILASIRARLAALPATQKNLRALAEEYKNITTPEVLEALEDFILFKESGVSGKNRIRLFDNICSGTKGIIDGTVYRRIMERTEDPEMLYYLLTGRYVWEELDVEDLAKKLAKCDSTGEWICDTIRYGEIDTEYKKILLWELLDKPGIDAELIRTLFAETKPMHFIEEEQERLFAWIREHDKNGRLAAAVVQNYAVKTRKLREECALLLAERDSVGQGLLYFVKDNVLDSFGTGRICFEALLRLPDGGDRAAELYGWDGWLSDEDRERIVLSVRERSSGEGPFRILSAEDCPKERREEFFRLLLERDKTGQWLAEWVKKSGETVSAPGRETIAKVLGAILDRDSEGKYLPGVMDAALDMGDETAGRLLDAVMERDASGSGVAACILCLVRRGCAKKDLMMRLADALAKKDSDGSICVPVLEGLPPEQGRWIGERLLDAVLKSKNRGAVLANHPELILKYWHSFSDKFPSLPAKARRKLSLSPAFQSYLFLVHGTFLYKKRLYRGDDPSDRMPGKNFLSTMLQTIFLIFDRKYDGDNGGYIEPAVMEPVMRHSLRAARRIKEGTEDLTKDPKHKGSSFLFRSVLEYLRHFPNAESVALVSDFLGVVCLREVKAVKRISEQKLFDDLQELIASLQNEISAGDRDGEWPCGDLIC